ncbi:MAG: hypothetical protein ACRDWD_04320 [Acidimicrobiia bacterium]
MTQAFASYLEGDAATGNQLVDDLFDSGYPPFIGQNSEWPGSLFSPLFFRMFVISADARNLMGEQQRGRMEQMISEYVDRACDPAEAKSDPWHADGSENQLVVRKTNCLLGTYALSHEDYPAWRDQLQLWLQERAKSGLHDEVHSQYERYTVASIYNLADFPGDAEIRQLGKQYLDLFWHLAAHEFNDKTAVQGASGSRLYQPDLSEQRGGSYHDPSLQWARDWLYMYDWHDVSPRAETNSAILTAASSGYTPLSISRDLALMDGKGFEYSARQPGRAGASASEGHAILRNVTVNDDYMLGASTYEPGMHRSVSAAENVWYGVSINNTETDRIVISGLANEKFESGNYADYYAINGVASEDVIIAARDHEAENSRGMRVYIGDGDLRTNLEHDSSGWIFTRAGDAYTAIRIPEPELDESTDENGQIGAIRLDGGEDIWVPIVIQMGQASTFDGYGDFKNEVRDLPYGYANGAVMFTSLRGHTYTMSRQEHRATLPRIDRREPNTDPPFTYDSPFLSMEWQSVTATLTGPDRTSVTLDFST